MDFQQLRVDHNNTMARLAIIDLFVDDNYNRGNRVDIKTLSRKLKLNIVETQVCLFTWIKALSNTREARVHRLCIFLSKTHGTPQWFGFLKLSTDDSRSIQNGSRHMGYPNKRHWYTLSRLVEGADMGWDHVVEELTLAREFVVGSLVNHGLVPDGTVPRYELTAEDCRQRYLGASRSNREDFGDIQIHHSWGYLPMEKLDALKDNPINSEDLHIFKKKGNTEDNSQERKAAAAKLRAFIDELQQQGLLFADKQVHHDWSGPANGTFTASPLLTFCRPNELCATIKVVFRQYADLGSVVLDV